MKAIDPKKQKQSIKIQMKRINFISIMELQMKLSQINLHYFMVIMVIKLEIKLIKKFRTFLNLILRMATL
jgi:hypothetical protein